MPGKDAGELVGLPATGVIASKSVDAMVALDADCVLYMPQDWDCTLLGTVPNKMVDGSPASPPEPVEGPSSLRTTGPSRKEPRKSAFRPFATRIGKPSLYGPGKPRAGRHPVRAPY